MKDKSELIESMVWPQGYQWSYRTRLGNKGDFFEFSVIWNTRNESFEVTIKTLENEEIISGRKMVLEVDLLEHCFSRFKPNKCALIPMRSKSGLARITYDSMINDDVKLYHISQKIKD